MVRVRCSALIVKMKIAPMRIQFLWVGRGAKNAMPSPFKERYMPAKYQWRTENALSELESEPVSTYMKDVKISLTLP